MPLKKMIIALIVVIALSVDKTNAQIVDHPATDSLAVYRKQIDSLDSQVINLLGKRMQVVELIGIYKTQHNMPALQQARFDALLKKNINTGKQVNLSEAFITDLMNAIHKESLQKEEEVKTGVNNH